jgi:DNA (cytosine-5)-methyltransferase 1
MREINLLDLFSGIGGFHLGLERAGFKVNAYNSEIDKYAIDVYKNNFKNSTYVGSVTDVRAEQLPRIDAITFGSPCQDFSLAGKRKGMGGARSSLITEAIRLIDECRPSFFIWENVKGTFSSNNGADFWAIIQAFANIGSYRLEWQLLNTKWFLPQNRERIYLVGYIGDGGGGQIFPIGSNDSEIDAPVDRGNTYTITARYKASTSQGGYINELYKVSSAEREVIQVSDRLDSGGKQPHQQDRIYDSEGISPALMRGKSDLIVKIGDFRNDEGYRERKDGNSPTPNARARNDIYGQPIVNKIRRLTPIECERLQGFPDNWTKYGTKAEISDSQRYKMCGNAVTVDVVQSVAKNILKVL